jgi:hypothetical protein
MIDRIPNHSITIIKILKKGIKIEINIYVIKLNINHIECVDKYYLFIVYLNLYYYISYFKEGNIF